MENKEFILEALKRLVPDTRWHGETVSDDASFDNLATLEDMIYFVLDELFADSIVPQENKGNWSFEVIARQKQKIISYIKEEYFDSNKED